MARREVWGLGGGTLVAGAAVALWLALSAREGPEEAAPAEGVGAGVAAADVAGAGVAAAPVAPPLVAATEVAPPTFDVVRVSREGEALVAGQALAGSAVTLRVDGGVVAQAAADPSGQFVALFTLAPSETMQVLTLEMADAQGRVVAARDTVMLLPRPAAGTATGEVPPAGDTMEGLAEGAPVVAPVVEDAVPAQAEGSAPEVAGTDLALAAEPPLSGLAPVAQPQGASAAEPAPPASADATSAEPAVEVRAEPEGPAAPGGAEGPLAAVAEAAPQPASEGSAPTAVLLRADGAVEVLDRAPQVMDNVVIDAITYSEAGDVQISGRAAAGDPAAALRIYLDNRPIAVAQAQGGDWRLDLPAIDAGVYTLRVDQVNAAGGVESRFETPFLRESRQSIAEARARTAGEAGSAASAPEAAPESGPALAPGLAETAALEVAAAPASTGQPRASLITVQPGHTLWAISRDRYGEGDRYMVIFNANREQIRDPDWIYPGQIFALPEN